MKDLFTYSSQDFASNFSPLNGLGSSTWIWIFTLGLLMESQYKLHWWAYSVLETPGLFSVSPVNATYLFFE